MALDKEIVPINITIEDKIHFLTIERNGSSYYIKLSSKIPGFSCTVDNLISMNDCHANPVRSCFTLTMGYILNVAHKEKNFEEGRIAMKTTARNVEVGLDALPQDVITDFEVFMCSRLSGCTCLQDLYQLICDYKEKSDEERESPKFQIEQFMLLLKVGHPEMFDETGNLTKDASRMILTQIESWKKSDGISTKSSVSPIKRKEI